MIVVCRVSTHCNLRCAFCAFDRRLPFARGQIDDTALARLIALLGRHRAERGEPVLLSWLGGEPLLWRQWPQHSAHARARGLAVSATTNGSTLHRREVRAAVLEHFSELTVSIDAPGPIHDQLGGWPGGYTRLRSALQALIRDRAQTDVPLRLRVNTVLMRRTLGGFADLTRELSGLGVDEISFNLLGGRDRPEFHAQEAPADADLDALLDTLPALRVELAAAGTRLLGDADYARRLAAANRSERWPIADCRPGEQFLFVDEHARIAPCAFTGDSLGVPLDEVRSIESLVECFRLARGNARPTICAVCPSTQVAGKFARPTLATPVVDWSPALHTHASAHSTLECL